MSNPSERLARLRGYFNGDNCAEYADTLWLLDVAEAALVAVTAEGSSSPSMSMADFQGHADRECGEHRTTGGRAWCHVCSTWCYPEQPCPGCEVPMLRARIAELQELKAALDALKPPLDTPDNED